MSAVGLIASDSIGAHRDAQCQKRMDGQQKSGGQPHVRRRLSRGYEPSLEPRLMQHLQEITLRSAEAVSGRRSIGRSQITLAGEETWADIQSY